MKTQEDIDHKLFGIESSLKEIKPYDYDGLGKAALRALIDSFAWLYKKNPNGRKRLKTRKEIEMDMQYNDHKPICKHVAEVKLRAAIYRWYLN